MDMSNVDPNDLVQSEDGKWHDAEGRRIWRTGTLTYTKPQLVRLFMWLLLSGFTYTLVTTSFPMMLPLLFKNRGFDSQKIAWLMGIMYVGAMVVGPIVGMWSDRTRTKWGRRRPFDLVTTPVWFVGLCILPFAKTFWLTNLAMLMIGFAGAATIVIWFLYNDVIPGELMGRFTGAIRFVGLGGALIFQFGLFPFFDTHPTFVMLACAIPAFTFEMLMLLMVKEGEYPPPPPKTSLFANVKTYVKDGLGSRYICLLWLTLGVVALGTPATNFFTLFFKGELSMTAKEIGFMMGTGTAISMALAIPSGFLVDKLGPNRVWGTFAFLVGVFQICMYFFVVDKATCIVFYLCYYAVNMILAAALMPMLFSHLPKEKFGQMTSFQSLLMQGGMFVSSMTLGAILAALGDAYHFVFLYAGVIYALSPLFLQMMIRVKTPFEGMEFSMRAGHKAGKEKQVDE